MCNDYRSRVELDTTKQDFSDIKIRIRFPEGLPNLQPRDDIRITDTGPIVRAAPDEPGAADLVQRRWSWPGAGGRPVYNFRSENREFTNGRCLIITDGFYEFTAHSDPKSRRKHKWLFTKSDEPWFCIAGIWRKSGLGEAFTMLTTEPGPDVAPYHNRQVVVLGSARDAAHGHQPALEGTHEGVAGRMAEPAPPAHAHHRAVHRRRPQAAAHGCA